MYIPTSLLRRLYHSSSSSNHYQTSITNYLDHHLNFFLSQKSLNLQSLLQSHAFIVVTGNHNNVFFTSKLISFYTSLSKPNFSTKVFDSVYSKDTFLWNSIIKSHFSNWDYEKVIEFFVGMRISNTPPNDFTIPMVIKACAELLGLNYGEMVHGLVLKFGIFGGYSAVGSSLVYFYSKCGCMGDAYKVFDEMSVRDVVTWTALVIGYLQNGESEKGLECVCLMHRIGEDDEKPNHRTLDRAIQACGNIGALIEGKCLHGLVLKSGYGFCNDVQSSVLSMYSRWGTVGESCRAFCEVKDKNVICWTSVIAAYAKLGCAIDCVRLFLQMQDDGLYPDEIVISCVLSSFCNPSLFCEGKVFHGLIMRRNFVVDQVVHRALISMYCRFGDLVTAGRIFAALEERNSETWNSMIFEFGKAGLWEKCLLLFRNMVVYGIECDSNSLISVVSSCSQLCKVHLGKSVHCYVIKHLLDDNVSISNSLLDMYGKCGRLSIAKSIFKMMQRDTISWNALISAYVYRGESAEAVALFDEMILEGLRPNSPTLATVLSACSRLGSLKRGMKVHNYIESEGIQLNVSLATALLDMYGKCGELKRSREIFDSIIDKDVISWNAMISCYGVHGDARSAIEVFEQMEGSSVRPNDLTFLAVLLACSHAGLTDEGRRFFQKMHDYSVLPSLKHYACIVDLLGKSGNLKEAEDIVLTMPMTPDGGIWGALLSACKIHNEVEIGSRIAKLAIKAEPENDGYYITLTNLLDSSGKWKEAEKFREQMKQAGVRKRSAWSAL